MTSATAAKPALAILAVAISAWRGSDSNVTSTPSGGRPRASQMLL